MLPWWLVLALIFVAVGVVVGRFLPPRAIDARMTVGGLLVFTGVILLVRSLQQLL